MTYFTTIWLISVIINFYILVRYVRDKREYLSYHDFGDFLLTLILLVILGPIFLLIVALCWCFIKMIKKG